MQKIQELQAGDHKLLSGTVAEAIVRKNGYYIAWTPTWEGQARPDFPAALAYLMDHLYWQNLYNVK